MPLYEFKCRKCEKEIEIQQKVEDDPPKCCGEEMKRLISLSSFRLRGGGWANQGYQKDKKK